jgi:hypothetical protein
MASEDFRIMGVAIRMGEKVYKLPAPNRHSHLIKMMAEELGLPTPIRGEMGFYLHDGEFVDRVQAKPIAYMSGQILYGMGVFPELYSEDMW